MFTGYFFCLLKNYKFLSFFNNKLIHFYKKYSNINKTRFYIN